MEWWSGGVPLRTGVSLLKHGDSRPVRTEDYLSTKSQWKINGTTSRLEIFSDKVNSTFFPLKVQSVGEVNQKHLKNILKRIFCCANMTPLTCLCQTCPDSWRYLSDYARLYSNSNDAIFLIANCHVSLEDLFSPEDRLCGCPD